MNREDALEWLELTNNFSRKYLPVLQYLIRKKEQEGVLAGTYASSRIGQRARVF